MTRIFRLLLITGLVLGMVFSAVAEIPGPNYIQLDITTPELYLDGVFGYAWEGSAEVYKMHIFSRLLWLDGTGRVTGGDLASDYSASEDSLSYTVTLRDNLKWTDGEPLTIEDVIWGIKATLIDSTSAGIFKSSFGSIVGAKEFIEGSANDLAGMSVEGNTITFKLAHPSSTFLYALGQWPVLPMHLLKNADPKDIYNYNEYWKAPIGCGPYKFKEVVTNEYALMEINPDYHGEKPGISEVYMALTGVLPSTLVPNNEIDFFVTQDPGVIGYMADYPNYTRYDVPVNYVRYLMCNTTGKGGSSDGTAVSNFLVRKALLHALDLEPILEQLYGPMASQANSKLSSFDSIYHNPDNVTLKYDPELAKSLLAEAGYDFNYDFTIAYYYNDQISLDFIATLEYYWEAIGMKVTSVQLKGDLTNLFYTQRDYDVLYAGLGFVMPEDTFGQFLDSSIMTKTIGSNPKWQELYNALMAAPSEEERIKACFDLQDFEQTQLTQLPLFNLDAVYYVNTARVSIPVEYFAEERVAYNRHYQDWKLLK